MHPKRSTDLFNLNNPNSLSITKKKILQQKQRKQLILSDRKNIFTYHFQPIQRLQPNFLTDGIRIFMAQQKQHKQLILTDNKIISTYHFQPIQRLQPNFITDGIRIFTARQKQHKQLILTDNKIISTYLF